jgi:CubicO group peptidase (beta-lactamase class C family)
MRVDAARAIVAAAIVERAFPGAVVEVGTSKDVRWTEAFGTQTYDPSSPSIAVDTVFDLASLTKVVATTTLVMMQGDEGRLRLADPIGRWCAQWQEDERRATVTIADALVHATGLPDWLPLYRNHHGTDEFAAAIARTPLVYAPRAQSVYSDLGFMLLGFIAERIGGATLDRLFDRVSATLQLGDIRFLPPAAWRPRTAPTEFDPWRGRLLVGEVHDENAAALEGVAGHAGLFGTAAALGRFARHVLRARRGEVAPGWSIEQATLALFTARQPIPGSSRALGWDTMLPTSSCGTQMSPTAFGHVGFTGTSLWIDPELDLYVVLLTNRVHPSRENTRIAAVRPAFHDAVVRGFKEG